MDKKKEKTEKEEKKEKKKKKVEKKETEKKELTKNTTEEKTEDEKKIESVNFQLKDKDGTEYDFVMNVDSSFSLKKKELTFGILYNYGHLSNKLIDYFINFNKENKDKDEKDFSFYDKFLDIFQDKEVQEGSFLNRDNFETNDDLVLDGDRKYILIGKILSIEDCAISDKGKLIKVKTLESESKDESKELNMQIVSYFLDEEQVKSLKEGDDFTAVVRIRKIYPNLLVFDLCMPKLETDKIEKLKDELKLDKTKLVYFEEDKEFAKKLANRIKAEAYFNELNNEK